MINLTYYKGKDLYSDGDIENEILDLIKKKIEPKEIIKNDNPISFIIRS